MLSSLFAGTEAAHNGHFCQRSNRSDNGLLLCLPHCKSYHIHGAGPKKQIWKVKSEQIAAKTKSLWQIDWTLNECLALTSCGLLCVLNLGYDYFYTCRVFSLTRTRLSEPVFCLCLKGIFLSQIPVPSLVAISSRGGPLEDYEESERNARKSFSCS